MIWLLSVLAFIVIFSVLILIHEFGHFFVARKCGIKVQEFGLGMPPRIWGFKPKKSETLYSINAIPFGGFVRLYGEDVYDKRALKSKKSFASKAPWQKIAVASAGVFLNIVLAYVLLVIGFSFGMQPLLVTQQDVFNAIDSGVVNVEEGIIVKESGVNDIGFEPGDKIVGVNDLNVVFGDEIKNLKDKENVRFDVERNGALVRLNGVNDINKPFFVGYDVLPMPRLVVKAVAENANMNLIVGDVIAAVDGKQIYNVEQLEKSVTKGVLPLITVGDNVGISRGGDEIKDVLPVIVSMVEPGSGAEKIGLKEGDEVISINGVKINSTADLAEAVKTEKMEGKSIYVVRRGSSEIEFYPHKDDLGRVGVLLSEAEYMDNLGITVYSRTLPYSIIQINDVSFPFHEAAWQGLVEIGRLSVLTGQMFVTVFESIFTKLSVPAGVAGPVGIAQMTFVFVQEGVMSLLRFSALLSLSLAVINILPFPGLDGGRIFLILIPALLGKKLNPKWEASIHVIGFLILMLMVLLVTFNDVMRLFGMA